MLSPSADTSVRQFSFRFGAIVLITYNLLLLLKELVLDQNIINAAIDAGIISADDPVTPDWIPHLIAALS
jgi:hypothetical protein